MATISNYIFTNLITINGTTPNLFVDEYNTLYATFANNYNDENFITLYSSPDNGVTWTEEDVPVSEKYTFDNPKVIFSNDIYYIFANAKPSHSTTSRIVLVRKFTNITDDDGNVTAEDFWEDDYTDLIQDVTGNHSSRITDCKISVTGAYIYITYDRELDSGTYSARFAVYSTVDSEIKLDIPIAEDDSINNHNAKLIEVDSETIGFAYETEYVSAYGGKTYQIAYTQYSLPAQEFTDTIQVSNDLTHNNYHQSITIDSGDTIYITWLNTQNVNYKGNITYYATNTIQFATISNGVVDKVDVITSEAKENEYPYIICDTSDNLFILYNKENKVQYLRQKYDEWVEIDELADNTWKMLTGVYFYDNLYTIVQQEDEGNYLVRIDTNLAEVSEPVRDLQIYDINNEQIGLAWTTPRNANSIEIQQKIAKIELWDYNLANTTTNITKATHSVQVVGLEDKTYYAFKLVYTTSDNKVHTQYFPEQYVDHSTNENFQFNWTINANTIKQELYVAKEKWQTVENVSVNTNNTILDLNSNGNCYRLYIKGGAGEGYSNIVSPLTIKLKDDNYVLSWTPFRNASKVELQQSIDNDVYYKAVDKNISTTDSTFTITNLNHVVYHYRIAYTVNGKISYTNVVTLTNNLQLLRTDYNSANVTWITVDKTEAVDLQISTDDGKSWSNKTFKKDNSTNITKISKLQYATKYKIRLYFSDRYTGQYSNAISFETTKHPIENLIVSCNSKDTINFQFDFGSNCTDAKIDVYDIYAGTTQTYQLSSLKSNLTKTDKNDPDTCYLNKTTHRIKGSISGLKKGTYYSLFVYDADAYYGQSEVSDIVNTTGDGISTLSATTVNAHDVTINTSALDRIDNTNAKDFVAVNYTTDNIDINKLYSDVSFPYTIKGLQQDTDYSITLNCYYGNNYGDSNTVKVHTKADKFKPITGNRINNECCFTYSNLTNLFYIFDKGKLYTYNKNTKDQNLLIDYNIKANHIYGAIDVDKNGKVHLVFTYGKGIYYATNCRTMNDDETIIEHQLNDIITINENGYVNEYLYPNITIDKSNNLLYIVWQADYGNYSNINYVQYRNAEATQTEVVEIIKDGETYYNLPKVVLKPDGGWSVFCIDSNGVLKCADVNVDNDYSSITYLQPTIEIKTVALESPCTLEYVNYDIWVDMAGGYKIFYDSIDEEGNKTSTYGTIDFDKETPFTLESVFQNDLHDVKLYAGKELVYIGKNDTSIYTGKYIIKGDDSEFSDMVQLNIFTDNNKPLTTCYDGENIYILTMYAGMWKIDNLTQTEMKNTNISTNDNLVSDPVEYQSKDENFVAIAWTSGDENNYPQVYIKINNDVKNITPTDEFGYPEHQVFKINSIEEADLTDNSVVSIKKENTKYILKITYNNTEVMYLDITDMLYYNWDNTTIINKLSDME